MRQQSNRRQFLKNTLSAFGVIFLGRIHKSFPQYTQIFAHADEQMHLRLQESEFYEGFLILPEEAPIPDFVQRGRGINLCQADVLDDPALVGETVKFSSPEEMQDFVSFPLFTLNELPIGIEFVSAYVDRYVQSSEIWRASVYFGAGSDYSQLISIHARPEYHRPFPVWPVRYPDAHDVGAISPEKISTSQRSIVLLPSVSGNLLQWIEQDILYSLVVEHDKSREVALAVLDSLIQV